jgi:hypothetical protein
VPYLGSVSGNNGEVSYVILDQLTVRIALGDLLRGGKKLLRADVGQQAEIRQAEQFFGFEAGFSHRAILGVAWVAAGAAARLQSVLGYLVRFDSASGLQGVPSM